MEYMIDGVISFMNMIIMEDKTQYGGMVFLGTRTISKGQRVPVGTYYLYN